MKKKEWIKYFKAINNRKPTKEEIDIAVTQGEYKVTLFDNFLSYIGKKLSNKMCLTLVSVIVILLITTILFIVNYSANKKEKESYNRIDGLQMDIAQIKNENYSSIQGEWSSLETMEVINSVPSKVGDIKLFINDKGKIKVDSDVGELVSVEVDDNYLVGNVKVTEDDEEFGLYASGIGYYNSDDDGYSDYYEQLQSIWFFEAGASFSSREELELLGIESDTMVPLSFDKDTIVFQAYQSQSAYVGSGGFSSDSQENKYYLFQRSDEISKSDLSFEESTIDVASIGDKDFTSVSGTWKSRNGHILEIENNQDTSLGAFLLPDDGAENGQIRGKLGYFSDEYPNGRAVYLNGFKSEPDAYLDDFGQSFMFIESGASLSNIWYLEGNKESIISELLSSPTIIPIMGINKQDVLILANNPPQKYDSSDAGDRFNNVTYTIFYKLEDSKHEETSKNSTTVSGSNQMNLEELSEGNLSSIVGEWKNNHGNTFEIEESGYLYQGDSLGYPLKDITVSSDGSATGFLNRNLAIGPGTKDYVTFIPAGVSIPHEENADITKDRIVLGGTVGGYNDSQVYYRVEE